MTKEDKDKAINEIIKQRESLKDKKYLECPVCSKMSAESDKHRPNILVCYSCMKYYQLSKQRLI